MLNIIPYTVKYKHLSFYSLIIDISCLVLLLKKFHDFKLIINYNPFKPTEEDIRIHEFEKL